MSDRCQNPAERNNNIQDKMKGLSTKGGVILIAIDCNHDVLELSMYLPIVTSVSGKCEQDYQLSKNGDKSRRKQKFPENQINTTTVQLISMIFFDARYSPVENCFYTCDTQHFFPLAILALC
jgi:hypothetical protein